MSKVGRRLPFALVGGASLWLAGAAVAAPVWAAVPGGYDIVAAAQTISPSGGTVSAQLAQGSASVQVPAGAFSSSVQVLLTSPLLASSSSSGLAALAGAGVLVEQAGVPIQTGFAHPVTLVLNDPAIASGAQAVAVSSAGETPIAATVSTGTATVSLASNTNVALMSQPAASASASSTGGSTVQGATTVQTGLALRGETVIAATLAALGVGGLWISSRRRRSASIFGIPRR